MIEHIETILAILTFCVSGIALYFSLRKQAKESQNIDADTISKLYDTIEKQEKRYDKLEQEFEEYKKMMNSQVASIAHDNVRLRAWANKLVRQLEEAQIIPIKFE